MDGQRRDHELEYVQKMRSRRGWACCATNCQGLIRSEPDVCREITFNRKVRAAMGIPGVDHQAFWQP